MNFSFAIFGHMYFLGHCIKQLPIEKSTCSVKLFYMMRIEFYQLHNYFIVVAITERTVNINKLVSYLYLDTFLRSFHGWVCDFRRESSFSFFFSRSRFFVFLVHSSSTSRITCKIIISLITHDSFTAPVLQSSPFSPFSFSHNSIKHA